MGITGHMGFRGFEAFIGVRGNRALYAPQR